ncbi:MAG: response regulator transcription factor [Wujia sp.]
MNRILIVEDDKSISNVIDISLKNAGYLCDCVYDGNAVADCLEEHAYDLALVDIMLPGPDGFSLMEYFNYYHVPVIFLTAMADVHDKVKGLKLGAEDYMVKPFEIIELLARVERVLRRYNKVEQVLRAYDVEVDTQSLQVRKAGEEIHLTKKEYEILLMFMRNPNVALFRERIFESVWHEPYYGDSRTVDLHVQRLRKKIGFEDKIVPVYKVGYRLEAET